MAVQDIFLVPHFKIDMLYEFVGCQLWVANSKMKSRLLPAHKLQVLIAIFISVWKVRMSSFELWIMWVAGRYALSNQAFYCNHPGLTQHTCAPLIILLKLFLYCPAPCIAVPISMIFPCWNFQYVHFQAFNQKLYMFDCCQLIFHDKCNVVSKFYVV